MRVKEQQTRVKHSTEITSKVMGKCFNEVANLK